MSDEFNILDRHIVVNDPWLEHAKDVILNKYGHEVSIINKGSDLLKWGRNALVGTTAATVMHLPSGVLDETHVATDLITTISSSDAGDTEVVLVEGHTVDGSGNFTFVSQTPTLAGQTQVTLATPLARVQRVHNRGSTNLVGSVYVYEDDTDTAGVPDTDALVHLIVAAGKNNSEKCAFTTATDEYFLVTHFSGNVLEKVASAAHFTFEIRNKSGVFIEHNTLSAGDGNQGVHDFVPYLIISPNADVRIRSLADGANTEITADLQGVLAVIV